MRAPGPPWIRRGRAGPASAETPAAVPAAVLAAVLAAAGLGGLGGLAGCGGAAAGDLRAEERGEPRRLVIFVYDRSASIADHQLEAARKLTTARLRALDHEDRIAGLEVLQRSLSEPPKRWSQTVPPREMEGRRLASDSVALARFLGDAAAYLAGFAEVEGRQRIDGTDLLSTLHDVAEELRPYPDREAILYIFSDMLQSGPEMEMEGLRTMPPEGWVERMAADGRLPDLSGLCVVAVGPRVDTREGQEVKAFWKKYFEVTGAVLLEGNYAYRPVTLPVRPCGWERGENLVGG